MTERRVSVLRVGQLEVGGTVVSAEGLVIRDEDGHDRLSLVLDAAGPELTFTARGTDAVALAVHDSAVQAFYPGVSLSLSDGDGEPMVAWHVDHRGTVTRLVGVETSRTRRWRFLGGSSVTIVHTHGKGPRRFL